MSSKRLLNAIDAALTSWEDNHPESKEFLESMDELRAAREQIRDADKRTWAQGHDFAFGKVKRFANEKLKWMENAQKPADMRPVLSFFHGREQALNEILDVLDQNMQGQECTDCGLPFTPWTVPHGEEMLESDTRCLDCELSARAIELQPKVVDGERTKEAVKAVVDKARAKAVGALFKPKEEEHPLVDIIRPEDDPGPHRGV